MKQSTQNFSNFKWVDIEKPDSAGLAKISQDLNLNEKMIRLSLDPEYLPKVHFLADNELFLVFRVIDPKPKQLADSIPELTTKISIYIREGLVVTLHRQKMEFVENLKAQAANLNCNNQRELVGELIWQIVQTFDNPLLELQTKLDQYDEKIFSGSKSKKLVRDGYFLKRHSTSFKKVLKFTLDNVYKLNERSGMTDKRLIECRDYLERFLFYADDVFENVNGLLNIYISLVSQKTNEASFKANEVMRVLTVFSVFFLPLNFIAGLYGMNFEYMPELKEPHGYFVILGVMAVFSAGLLFYIWKKGWLKPPEDQI